MICITCKRSDLPMMRYGDHLICEDCMETLLNVKAKQIINILDTVPEFQRERFYAWILPEARRSK